MKSSDKSDGTFSIGNRWQLTAAVTGSVLLHAALLFGHAASRPPAGVAASGTPPIRVHLLHAVVAERAPSSPTPVAQKKANEPVATRTPPAPTPNAARVDTPTAAAATAVAEESGYRAGPTLDPPPRPLQDIEPEYPAAAGLREGSVVLRLSIGATGKVDTVEVLSAEPPGFFEASALAAFGKANFAPGRYLGQPVRSQITIEVQYTPVDRGDSVSGQSGAGLRR